MKSRIQPHFIEAGSGPPLLLLHGLFDSLETWERLIPHLSAQFRVYALDLPAFGRSALPDDWPESLTGMVDTVICFFDARGIEKISVAGSSMGGGLALAVAQRAPSRIDKIALLNPYALPETPFAVRNARRPFVGALLPYLLRKRAIRCCAKGIFARSLFDKALLTEPLVERVAHPFYTLARRKNLFRFLRGISPAKIREIDENLSKIEQPVLMIWGMEDGWLSDAHWRRLEARLPRARVMHLPQCGHLPQLEQPEAVAKALIPFFLGKDSQVTP